MENLHLKNLDMDKILKKSKTKDLSEQIKVNMQTPTVINVDKEDAKDYKNIIFESIAKFVFVALVALGLSFVFITYIL